MKKNKLVVMVLAIALLVLPIFVNADVKRVDLSKYKSQSIEDALKQEGIEYSFKHTDNDNQVNIILFRGSGCSHCHEFLEYVAKTLMNSHGDKIRFTVYETWYTENNAELFEGVAASLGTEASGVPFFVIGKQYFAGYSESMNASIVAAIDEEYAKKKADRYNAIDEYVKSVDEAYKAEQAEKAAIINRAIIWNFVFTLFAVVIVLAFVNKKFNDLEAKMGRKNTVVERISTEEAREVHTTTKKKSNKGKK